MTKPGPPVFLTKFEHPRAITAGSEHANALTFGKFDRGFLYDSDDFSAVEFDGDLEAILFGNLFFDSLTSDCPADGAHRPGNMRTASFAELIADRMTDDRAAHQAESRRVPVDDDGNDHHYFALSDLHRAQRVSAAVSFASRVWPRASRQQGKDSQG